VAQVFANLCMQSISVASVLFNCRCFLSHPARLDLALVEVQAVIILTALAVAMPAGISPICGTSSHHNARRSHLYRYNGAACRWAKSS
jgi:hypothetical protein